MNDAISSLKGLNHALKNVQPIGPAIPRRDHPTALELIVGSVATHYIGDLESDEDRHGAVWYRPSDEEDIREITASIWGKYLSTTVCEEIAEQIIREGWPELSYLNYREYLPVLFRI
jgi:hypothetical protein